MPRVSGSGKRVNEVAADFVAAGADRRADGRVNIYGACPELAHQRFNGTPNGPCGNTSPAGMNRGNGTRPCIGKQHGTQSAARMATAVSGPSETSASQVGRSTGRGNPRLITPRPGHGPDAP